MIVLRVTGYLPVPHPSTSVRIHSYRNTLSSAWKLFRGVCPACTQRLLLSPCSPPPWEAGAQMNGWRTTHCLVSASFRKRLRESGGSRNNTQKAECILELPPHRFLHFMFQNQGDGEAGHGAGTCLTTLLNFPWNTSLTTAAEQAFKVRIGHSLLVISVSSRFLVVCIIL